MNLDGFALPIKKLKGTDPVDSLDFYKKSLGPASAVVIGSLIRDNASLTSISLANNQLCGLTTDKYSWLVTGGTYDATGVNAIADALRVNASLTEVRSAAFVWL